MNFEMARVTNMEEVVGFVFAAMGTHHPVMDVNSPKRATVRADLTPSTRTPRDFLPDLGRNGGHAAPRMVRATCRPASLSIHTIAAVPVAVARRCPESSTKPICVSSRRRFPAEVGMSPFKRSWS